MMKVSFFSKSILTATLTLATALTFFGCDNGGGDEGGGGLGNVNCEYDGGAVTIGDQTWMSENLNCNVAGSKCYDNDLANCEKYGRLYDWTTAMNLPDSCKYKACSSNISAKHKGICPNGWHIPTNDEWETLSSYVENAQGCSRCDAKHLKAESGWYDWDGNGSGYDTYGFTALPGSSGISNGNFILVGEYGYWLSATESYAGSTYYCRNMHYSYEYADWNSCSKNDLLSIRCVMD